MTKYTIQERFYLFAAITLMYAYGYQFYFNQRQDKRIDDAFQGHNKTYKRSVEVNNELRAENMWLKHNFIHEQVTHEATKNHIEILEKKILGEKNQTFPETEK